MNSNQKLILVQWFDLSLNLSTRFKQSLSLGVVHCGAPDMNLRLPQARDGTVHVAFGLIKGEKLNLTQQLHMKRS